LSETGRSAACASQDDRNLTSIASVFLTRGWLTPGSGRGLRLADDFGDNVEKWLAI